MGSTNHVTDEEEQEFLPKPRSTDDANAETETCSRHHRDRSHVKRGLVWWLRLLMEVGMAATIAYLIVFKPFVVTRDRILRTPVPQFPRKLYTFKPDDRLANKEMWFNQTLLYRTLSNWVELSSDSRGYVLVDHRERYDLPEPYDVSIDRHTTGPGYMMTVFHELHCLSYLSEHLFKGYSGEKLTDDVAFHLGHCITYLIHGITCNADVTLEGATTEGPGEGSVHECVDYDELLKWANAHSAMKWNSGLMPGETIL
ncbi:hypothetical protein VTJ83DRAFT_6164 [Remersonia thermophila]|uniref:Oxidase ustYa n=1 Tax=Remersonia thermophila TaxID=72144 RepID=A0ABR4D8W7_9PEZI